MSTFAQGDVDDADVPHAQFKLAGHDFFGGSQRVDTPAGKKIPSGLRKK